MNDKNQIGFSFENGEIVRQNEEKRREPENNEEDEQNDELMNHVIHAGSKKAFISTVIICVIIALVLFSCAVACYIIFRVDTADVSGSSFYGKEEILSAAGIEKNTNLLIFDAGRAAEKIKDKLPRIDGVQITKVFPDKLEIEITDAAERYYVKLGNDIFTLSDDLRVTGTAGTVPVDKIELISVGIVSAVIGEKLVFSTDTHYNYLKNLLSEIRAHGISRHIVRVDMSAKFNVKLKYGDRFIIVIGEAENVKTKLDLSERIIASLNEEERGILYVDNLEKNSFQRSDLIE